MGWEVGERFKRRGTYVYLRLIHVDIWQKPTEYYKTIILQLKIKKKKNVSTKSHLLNAGMPTIFRKF